MEIAVCDDNKLFLLDIAEHLKTLSVKTDVYTFSDLDAFRFSINGGMRYDVVIMDIEWESKVAGMDTAAELYKVCPDTKVIFVTGSAERYSQRIFLQRSNLSGYLVKPVETELLLANLQKAADEIQDTEQPVLVLRQKGTTVSIPIREICFVESSGHTVNVHTDEETVTAYERLESIKRSLPPGFYHCHKSFIVNMSHIRRFQPNDILLKNGKRVPVSRSKYNETKTAYFRFAGQMF